MTTWLLDTGPLVAYLDSRDPMHGRVARCMNGFTGRLISTSAVITEAMYFVSAERRGPRLLAELVSGSEIQVYDFSPPADLLAAVSLMETYSDTPMDYADATLLLLAEGLGVREILTLDRRGFSTFRTRDGHPLTMVLDLESGDRCAGR